MSWSFAGQQWWRRGALIARVSLALLAACIVASCAAGHETVVDVGVQDTDLVALLADGKLPPEMQPPAPMPPPAPPRFCGDFGFPGPVFPGGPMTEGPVVGVAGGAAPTPAGAGGGAAGAGSPADGGAAEPEDGGIGAGPDPSCASVPIGRWTFDDCNVFRSDLSDSSFQGNTAFRNVDLGCGAGRQGSAPVFKSKDDLVYVPDQPEFALDLGVTIAAWVRPDAVTSVQTLLRKRDDGNSAFALVINNKRFQFIVRLASGRVASVSAPAAAGRWQHVAATHDGSYLRLYLGGSEVASARATGVLTRGVGPLLMGNDGSGRRFHGRLDNVWFNTLAAPAATINELTCLRQDPLIAVTPAVGPSVPAGTPVAFTLSVTNQDDPVCAPGNFDVNAFAQEGNFTFDPPFFQIAAVAPGATVKSDIRVSSGTETEAGNYLLNFFVQSQFDGGGPIFPPGIIGRPGIAFPGSAGSAGSTAPATPEEEPAPPPPTGFVQTQAEFVVAEPTGCHVSSQRELMIRHVSVVEDPARTTHGGPASDPRTGAWTFARLMQDMSPTAADAPDVVESMFRTFLTPVSINGFPIPVRPPMETLVLQPWPRTADGKLDLARAPLRLLAITHRLDLAELHKGKGGEGRFTFGVIGAGDFPMEFTVILEYMLPASNDAEYREWVDAVHGLQELPFPSEEYNQALQAVTERFTGRGALPGAPNGSAIIDIRTNEIALSDTGVWQLREFRPDAESGFMVPHPLFQTPDSSFNFQPTLGEFINQNEASILTEFHEVPPSFKGAPFQAAAVFNNIDSWNAPGITNPEARHKFSLNTCNGCHGAETGTSFLHVFPRIAGQQSQLSGFLTGTTVFDPQSGQQRQLNELSRRRKLLEAIVCEGQP